MHGDIGRIPIISFGGCKPLTDILQELPIPKSTHVSIGAKTLLYDPKLVLDAYRCINISDDRVIRLLLPAITSASVGEIEFQEEFSKHSVSTQVLPSLLKSLLDENAFPLDHQGNKGHPLLKLRLPPFVPVSSKSETSVLVADVAKEDSSLPLEAAKAPDVGSYSAVCIAPLRISLKKTSICNPLVAKCRKPKRHHLLSEEKQPFCGTAANAGDPTSDAKNSELQPSRPTTLNPESSSYLEALTVQATSSSTGLPGSSAVSGPLESIRLDTASTTYGRPHSLESEHLLDSHVESGGSCVALLPHAITSVSLPSTDIDAVRRVPDPEISQLFHSAALFHAYQPHCEPENPDRGAGGGLFDDWVDSPLKPVEPPRVTNLPSSADCTYSLSVSSPSPAIGAAAASSHAPHSAGTSVDFSTCLPRSPQSVLSNHSSYPTTPGGGLGSVPSVLPSLPTGTSSPPLHLKYTHAHPNSHPSIRLFGDPDSTIPLSETHVDEQPRIAPHGLAAYLPRSSSLRQQSAMSGSSDLFVEGFRSMSPKSCASPDRAFSGPNSVSTVDSLSGPSSTGKGATRTTSSVNTTCSRDPSPTPRTSFRGRFSGRKLRGCGRRRRTEVEELRIWNVNDHAQQEMEQKSGSSCQITNSFIVDEAKQVDSKDSFLLGSVESSVPECSRPDHSKDLSVAISAADHGIFTEALVERVKRRRQQREVGSQKRQIAHSDVASIPSVELSPESTSPPPQPSVMFNDNIAFSENTWSHHSRSLLPTVHSAQQKRSHTRSSGSDTSSSSNAPFVSSIDRIRSNNFISSAETVCTLSSPAQKQHTLTCTVTTSILSSSVSVSHSSTYYHTNNALRPSAQQTTVISPRNRKLPDPYTSPSSILSPISSRAGNDTGTHAPVRNDVPSLLPSDERDSQPAKVQLSYTLSDSQEHCKCSPKPPALIPASPYSPGLHDTSHANDLSLGSPKGPISGVHMASISNTLMPDIPLDETAGMHKCFTGRPRGRPRKHQAADTPLMQSDSGLSDGAYTQRLQADLIPLDHHELPLGADSADIPVNSTNQFGDNLPTPLTERSTNSISNSSPQLFQECIDSYIAEQRCLTPSTIAYTHSSAMEDSESGDSEVVSPRGTERRGCNLLNGHTCNMSHIDSSSQLSDMSSSFSDDMSSNSVQSLFSSPSALSSAEDDRCSTGNVSDAERVRSDTFTLSTSVLTQFTTRLSKILRRVEEIDLLKVVAEVGVQQTANGGMSVQHDRGPHQPSPLPESARLSRHELSSLYAESAQIRLEGSMYSIPTGRLVRFLTLLLVNMQAGVPVSLPPITNKEAVRFLELRLRQKHRERERIQADHVTESLLWSSPPWASILTGLDCARTALNIIVAPDMPRPLLMEDLVDGIISVVKYALERVVFAAPRSVLCGTSRNEGHPTGLSNKHIWDFTVDCIGYRVSQLMATLSSLLRFQPSRFTDNLVIRLTWLGLSVPLQCLKTGQSIDRNPKRLTSPLFRRMLSSSSIGSSCGTHASMPVVTASRLWLLVWPGHLQRASLALLSGVYGQYEAHRKLIVDEIFAALLSLRTTPSASAAAETSSENKLSGDRRVSRTFRLISYEWLYAMYKHRNQPDRPLRSIKCFLFNAAEMSTDNCFLYVHAVTAMFLSLTQSLVQAPGSPSSATGGSSTSLRKTSTSSSEQANAENSQFSKDEKQVLASYNTCVRHAHYLLSGLIKKVCMKSEIDLRPVLETVSSDLVAVASVASVEWPAAFTLLNVLSGLAIQNINQSGPNHNSTNTVGSNPTAGTSRSVDLSTKLTCLDVLSILAVGFRRCFPLPSFLENSIAKTEKSGQHCNSSSLRSRIGSAQAKLIGYVSSPMPVLQNWLLQPGVNSTSIEGIPTDSDEIAVSMECMKWIRLELTDPLLVSAQRFFLASWLYYCTRETGDTVSGCTGVGGETYAVTCDSKSSMRVQDSEKLRHQFLSELALTSTISPSSLSWLLGSKQPGAVGSSSLSSPTCSSRGSRVGSLSQLQSTAASAGGGGSCPVSNKFLGCGGSILTDRADVQRFVNYAHTRHLDARYRLLFAAHAFWALGRLSLAHPIMPRFEKLLSIIVRLVSESSVPIRTKALRCLASVVELDPNLFSTSSDPNQPGNGITNMSAWFRDLPKLVHPRLLDNSTAVREAAVDLVSRILVARPRMLSEYYPMLAERILDKGVSVRKRVVRCFRDLLFVDHWPEELSASKMRSFKKKNLLIRQFGMEMCLKLIRRLHDDEESIKKLVIELFQNLWFTPITEDTVLSSKLLNRRIINFGAVTSAMRSNNFDALESYVKQILTTEDPVKCKQLEIACHQLGKHLIKLIGRLSAPFFAKHPTTVAKQRKHSSSSLPTPNLQSALASLHLLSRCRPDLFIDHLDFLLDLLHKTPITPVLSSNCSVSSGTPQTEVSSGMDVQCLFHLINTTEMLLQSLAEAISNNCLYLSNTVLDRLIHIKLPELQSDLIRLIQRQGRVVVDSSLSCLATLTNRVLKDHTQVAACFGQFYGLLINLSFELQKALSTKVTNSTALSFRTRPSVLRALYTVGLMCKRFRLEDLTGDCDRVSTSAPVLDEVVDTLMLFAEYAAAPVMVQNSVGGGAGDSSPQAVMNDPDLCRKAVMGLGFLVSRYDQLLCTKRLETFFSRFFVVAQPITSHCTSKPTAFHEVQYIILDNLMHYFLEVEKETMENSRLWASIHKSESLKELSDRQSGYGSAVAQKYLPLVIRHCVLTPSSNVRTAALGLISIIIRQGLVHPAQTIAALICFQTDPDGSNRTRASHLLLEAEQKAPGFVAMRAAAGVHMSYHLHLLLNISNLDVSHCSPRTLIIRGLIQEGLPSPNSVSPGNGVQPVALNHAVYAILRPNRQSRRSFISSLLSSFVSEQRTSEPTDLDTASSDLFPSVVSHDPLGRLIFLSDQLAHFPYATQDETFYVAFTVERLVSDCGSTLLHVIQHALLSSLLRSDVPDPVDGESTSRILRAEADLHNLLDSTESRLNALQKLDAEDAAVSLHWDSEDPLQKLFELCRPSSLRQKCCRSFVKYAPVCFLLLAIREHLREVYGVTDSKLKDYSPTDSPKQWDKPVQPARRPQALGQALRLPSLVLQCMKNPAWSDGTTTPPDKIILFHFVQLRYRLLALEGGHLPDSVPSCSESSTVLVKEDTQGFEHNTECNLNSIPRNDAHSFTPSQPSVHHPKELSEAPYPPSTKSLSHLNTDRPSARPVRSKDSNCGTRSGNSAGRLSSRALLSRKRRTTSSSSSSSSSLSSCYSSSPKRMSSVKKPPLNYSKNLVADDRSITALESASSEVCDKLRRTNQSQSSKFSSTVSTLSPKPNTQNGCGPKVPQKSHKKHAPRLSSSSSSDLKPDNSDHSVSLKSTHKLSSKTSQKPNCSSHSARHDCRDSTSNSFNGASKSSANVSKSTDPVRCSLSQKPDNRTRIYTTTTPKLQPKGNRSNEDFIVSHSKRHDKPVHPHGSTRTLAPLPKAMMQPSRVPSSIHISSKRKADLGKAVSKVLSSSTSQSGVNAAVRHSAVSHVRSSHLCKKPGLNKVTGCVEANHSPKKDRARKSRPACLSDSSSLSSDSVDLEKHTINTSLSSSSVSSVSTTSSSDCTLSSSPTSAPPTKMKKFRKPLR